MSGFLTPLVDHQIGVHLYQLDAPLAYHSDLVNADIVAPKDFQTDEESCPRWLPIIYALFGDVADEIAIIHDWLYYSAIFDRATSDKILLEGMGLIGVPAWQKMGIYYGLKIGGWKAWNDHRKAKHSATDFKTV